MSQSKAIMIMVDPSEVQNFSNPKYAQRYEFAKDVFFPEMKKHGMEIEIFPAISPKNIKIEEDRVSYKEIELKRGVSPGTGQKINNFEISLAYAHMLIYMKAVEENCNILIFEDDVIVEKKNAEYTMNCIREFVEDDDLQKTKSLLYLQSTCPWRKDKPKKFYPEEVLKEKGSFYRLQQNWYDMSGTLAYMVNPLSASSLIEYIKEDSLKQADGLLHQALSSGKIDIYVPKNYQSNFELHPTLS